MARARWVAFVVAMVASASACGEALDSSSSCADAVSSVVFVDGLAERATESTLSVQPIRSVESRGGCDTFAADVSQTDSERFGVSLYITSVGDAAGVAGLLDAEISAWEEITDDPVRDSRARRVEQLILGTEGLGGALVEGRCSQIDATCRYWIGVDRWLIDAQLLYFGVLASYDSSVPDGDDLMIAVASLLGQQVAAGDTSE